MEEAEAGECARGVGGEEGEGPAEGGVGSAEVDEGAVMEIYHNDILRERGRKRVRLINDTGY